MSGLTTATANAVLDDQLGTTARTAPTGPMKVYLETVAGTASSAGTLYTGYTPPTVVFGAAASGSAANTGSLTIACSVNATIVGAYIADSAGTPVRKFWGPLTTNRTVAAGDSLAFSVGAIVVSIAS